MAHMDRWTAMWRAFANSSKDNHLVQGEATMTTLRRFVWLLYFLAPIHFLLALWYGVYYDPGIRTGMQDWAHGKFVVQLFAVNPYPKADAPRIVQTQGLTGRAGEDKEAGGMDFSPASAI